MTLVKNGIVVLAIVTLGLVTGATVASADCAWVMWIQTVAPGSQPAGVQAVAVAAWNNREECEREREARLGKGQNPAPASYVCLPDTIDPRGPKGGK